MHDDTLHRYLFNDVSVRGELIQLSEAFRNLTASKDYPAPVKILLGELMAATCLLTATLKFEGSITVQIQGDGPVSLLVINGNYQQVMRGTARWKDSLPNAGSLQDFIGKGQIVISIEPTKGERYQGIVDLEGETLAACLENYFTQSEQLATRLWLRTDEKNGKAFAGGLLLQVLPSAKNENEDFDHLAQLTATIKNDELFTLDAEELLHRLYHQENVTLFPENKVTFQCSCSRERTKSAVASIPHDELESIIKEEGEISLQCDYCGTNYKFDLIELSFMFDNSSNSSDATH